MFKGATLSRTKKLQWPRIPSPAAELDSARPREYLASRATAVADDWDGIRHAVDHLWDCRRAEPVIVSSKHVASVIGNSASQVATRSGRTRLHLSAKHRPTAGYAPARC